MGFICPICKKRKDGKKKKSNLSCVDCYDEACGKKTRRSELKEWKESVRKRDEELVAAADEMRRNQEQIRKDAEEAWKLKQEAQRMEAVLEMKEKEKIENVKKRKRLAEGGPTGAEKRFCDLGPRRRRDLVTAAVEELKVLGKSDVKDVLRAVSARVLGEDFESQVQLLKNNIATFCATQLPTLPDRCRIAAALTRGLSLNEAEYLTGVAQSSISWGRAEIEAGRRTTQEVILVSASQEQTEATHHVCIDVALSASSPHGPRGRGELV